MPATSSKRATPARKKAKLAHDSTSADKEASNGPVSEAQTQVQYVEASASASSPSRNRPRRSTQKVTVDYAIEPSPEESPEPSTSTPTSPRSAATALATPTASTPQVIFATPPPKNSAKGKGKARAKSEDEDYNDDAADETSSRRDPDLEIFTLEGPIHDVNRVQLKTSKAKAMRPFWLQGAVQPTFFGVPTSDVLQNVADQERDAKSEAARGKHSLEEALPWPQDGLAETCLDSKAYPLIKKSLQKFWLGYVGWIPNEGVYDMAWYPGKATGYRESQERSAWVKTARQQLMSGENHSSLTERADRVGSPFVQRWLDTHRHTLKLLTTKTAQPFLQDTTTPQQSAVRHPTTVMKLTVPEISMRSRLKRHTLTDTPKTPKKPSRSKTDGGNGEADDAGEGSDEEFANEDENAIAAFDANQEPINLDDPKFANIPNLGIEEKGPQTGDVLHISVGPSGQERPVQIPRGMSERLDRMGVVPDEGHIMNAGGHVYDLGWVPVPVHLNTGKEYFVVSAAGSKAPMTLVGQKQQRPAPASLQVWSVSPDSPAASDGGKGSKGEAKLEMVVCHEMGAAYKVAFCPIGHDYSAHGVEEQGMQGRLRRLGLLAGCFADGSLSIFSIPNPDSIRAAQTKSKAKASADTPLYIRLDPILTLEHLHQSATSLSWAGGELLAFGGSQGWIGVWNIGRILRNPSRSIPPPPPDYVIRAHRSAITDLTFILAPPISSSGHILHTCLPQTLFSVSLDGWTAYISLPRCSATSIERSRAVHYACTFSPFTGGSLVHEMADGSIAHYSLRPEEMLRSRSISHTPSRVLSLSCSAFHPIVAAGTAHGEVKLANIFRTLRRSQRNHVPIYQQVLDRTTGELTVKHHLLAEVANNAEPKKWAIAQWHPSLAVTGVEWNPNLGRCRLLLSGTAGGMLKVDFVKPPYES
ncbi:hypothetical protein NDA14_003063 [Ustilago hordei]|uniref:uncharacterized protein n=1 Tax=Ustilago hordei TaxID=120017 RepID=UPI001A3D6756|nr:uncharacterized protein UHO2_03375 [Ustilago hordei]KAJ1599821.1 hypothetical protein NDA14_003063 [Ustilago hordei]SYW84178.1 uncharacterized protein UHO2_03375 [Ustilago hordei]